MADKLLMVTVQLITLLLVVGEVCAGTGVRFGRRRNSVPRGKNLILISYCYNFRIFAVHCLHYVNT